MRFSAAVNVPWDKGEGRRRVEEVAVEDVVVADKAKEGRGAPEPLEEEDVVRWWGRWAEGMEEDCELFELALPILP